MKNKQRKQKRFKKAQTRRNISRSEFASINQAMAPKGWGVQIPMDEDGRYKLNNRKPEHKRDNGKKVPSRLIVTQREWSMKKLKYNLIRHLSTLLRGTSQPAPYGGVVR